MRIIDRYIVKSILIHGFTMTCIAVFALLLERLLRLLNLAANPDKVMTYVSQMLVTLIPHYLAIALPAAFFLAVLLTYGRLQRNNEIAVLTGSGIGLQRLMVPAVVFGIVLMIIAGYVASYLQPLGRYAYRSLVHAVEHASLSAALREGTFIHAGGLTFFADRFAVDGGLLSRVFVHENSDGISFATTAANGVLIGATDESGSTLVLGDGLRVGVAADGGITDHVQFTKFRWSIESDGQTAFRSRGKDERELTVPELWHAIVDPPGVVTSDRVRAEFHSRLARSSAIVILPLLAIPLAMFGGRGRQSPGVISGVIILVIFEEALRFGESLTAFGQVSPWFGIWLPVGVLAALAAYLSYETVFTVPKQPFDRGWWDVGRFFSGVIESRKAKRGTP